MKVMKPLPTVPEFVWLRAKTHKGENAAFLLEEKPNAIRIEWAVNGEKIWLNKDDYIITKDSDRVGRRGRRPPTAAKAPTPPAKKKAADTTATPTKKRAAVVVDLTNDGPTKKSGKKLKPQSAKKDGKPDPATNASGGGASGGDNGINKDTTSSTSTNDGPTTKSGKKPKPQSAKKDGKPDPATNHDNGGASGGDNGNDNDTTSSTSTANRLPLEETIEVGDWLQKKFDGHGWAPGKLLSIKRSNTTGRYRFIVKFTMVVDDEQIHDCYQCEAQSDSDKGTRQSAANDAVEWALAHGVAFRSSPSSTVHVPFALTPMPITSKHFETLKTQAGLLGKLIHAASENHDFLQAAIEPIVGGDLFFLQLWEMHLQLKENDLLKRTPLLIMRSDFMDDAHLGPRLIEFNAIAAGMQPFGQRIHELHSYIKNQWPADYSIYNDTNASQELVENQGLHRLAEGIARATSQIKAEFNDQGQPRFLMVVQENEDNVYDQHLLEYALNKRGIHTIRRSFKELHGNLETGQGHRLLLQGVGPIDTVYLRAGYLHTDYCALELDSDNGICCSSLMKTRVFMEHHRVAINATVNQQLASSKRVQTLLSAMTVNELEAFGLDLGEAQSVKELLGENWPVTQDSIQWMQTQSPDQWVLKNQGEGGGHAIMGHDILPKLKQLTVQDYPAWSVMKRLRPAHRTKPTLVVRKGKANECQTLISEIGIFTIHIDGIPATKDDKGYTGYLIRSKPAEASEGGVHSGLGVLDSLVYADE